MSNWDACQGAGDHMIGQEALRKWSSDMCADIPYCMVFPADVCQADLLLPNLYHLHLSLWNLGRCGNSNEFGRHNQDPLVATLIVDAI